MQKYIIFEILKFRCTEMTYSKGIYDASRVETVVVVDRFDVVRIMFSHCFAFI